MLYLLCDLAISQNITIVENSNFTGAIFPAEYNFLDSFLKDEKRFTPTEAEILDIEKKLRLQIRKLENQGLRKKNRKQYVAQHLKNYVRQYTGYYDQDGNRIIYINSIWSESANVIDYGAGETEPDWKIHWLRVMDCGIHCWNVKYNATRKRFIDFSANNSMS